MIKIVLKVSFMWLLSFSISQAQPYELVWEENFSGNTLNMDFWNYETTVGIWNTGSNRELQHYRSENVTVGPDGEGNSALIITAKKEYYNGYQFTSGRINTGGKVAARFGKVEARIKLPVLENGLWPAFWMLGTENGWPASGEIDIMEAGHSLGIANGTQRQTFNGALHWDNNGSYAGYGPQYTAPPGADLYGYNIYTMIWTPARIEMFFNDDTQPYFAMNITGADAEEFRDWPHYFILNLAVGGSFPGITNPTNITAPFPALMYVDYIRLYQREGETVISPPVGPPISDFYGIFSERTNIEDHLELDNNNGHLYIWNNLQTMPNQSPYEGNDLLAYMSPGSGWSGFGLFSSMQLDLTHFANGNLHFAVIIPNGSTDVFRVLMEGRAGPSQQGSILFSPGADPHGVSRDGHWHRVNWPLSDLVSQGLNLSDVANVFAVVSGNPSSGYIFDDIYLSSSTVTGSRDIASEPEMHIYPNPARGFFSIHQNAMIELVTISDVRGFTAFNYLPGEVTNSVTVDCSSWPKGVFLISVYNSNGQIQTGKVLVN